MRKASLLRQLQNAVGRSGLSLLPRRVRKMGLSLVGGGILQLPLLFSLLLPVLCAVAGCRTSPAPLAPTPPEGESARPVDLTAALGASWTASATPTGEESSGTHADFDLKVTAQVKNTASASLEAGRAGYVVLEAPNLEIAPLRVEELGGFTLAAGGAKTLDYSHTYSSRAEGRKLWLPKLTVRIACTAPIAVAGGRAEPAVIVGKFPHVQGVEVKTEVWPLSEGYLRMKAGGKDEWSARLASKLLEDYRGERG